MNECGKEEILNLIEIAASGYEKTYHGCSRSVLKALQEHLGLADGAVLRASTPLAAAE